MKTIRKHLAAGVIASVFTCMSTSCLAGTLNIIVPYPAGQVSDIIARTFRDALAKMSTDTVLVENVAGAGGAIGAQRILSAPADANTVLLASPNEVILAPLANAAVKYRSEDFRPLVMVASAPLVVVTRSDLPVVTADDLVTLARAEGKTKPLSYGSVGIGSLYHLMGESLSSTISAPLNHIPYRGGAPMFQDLIGGRLDFAMIPYSQSLQGFVDDKKMKLLGTVSKDRPEGLKNLPTVNEGKELKNFTFAIWTGFMVHKDTPQASVDKLQAQFVRAFADPVVKNVLEAQKLILMPAFSNQELNRFYTDEVARYKGLANSIKLTPQ